MLTEGDELTREAAELLFAMHPEAPWCLVTDLVSDKVAAHELVRMVVLTSELIASAAGDGKPSIPVNRATRGALTLNAMGEIGLKSLRELLELQSTGFPEELLKAMIELRGTTTSTDIVGKLLGLST
jgi:hypothetical protein